MRKVKKIHTNWFYSTEVGEEYITIEVGVKGVTKIVENEPHNGLQKWNYEIYHDDNIVTRTFNVDYVEYFKA